MKGLKSPGLRIKLSFVVENGNYRFSCGIMHFESHSGSEARVTAGCKCVGSVLIRGEQRVGEGQGKEHREGKEADWLFTERE